MRLWILALLLFIRVVAGIYIISPNISTAWNLSAPQIITWSTTRRDTPEVDIYALWWKSTNANSSIAANTTATNSTSSFSQTSIPIAFGVDTNSKLWKGTLPPGIPPNSFITVRMVTAGRSVCDAGGSCTRFIQAESQEFITFNNNSTVTRLPNDGIRTTVPTPTPNSTKTIPTVLYTITMSFTETITSVPDETLPSDKTSIIAGVAGGVGGLLLGVFAAASIVFFRNRRQKREEQPYTGVRNTEPLVNPLPSNLERLPMEPGSPASAPPRSTFEETGSQNTWQTGDRTSASPELRARWAGGTRYEPVSPEEHAQGARRIAMLEFRPRVNQGIPFNE